MISVLLVFIGFMCVCAALCLIACGYEIESCGQTIAGLGILVIGIICFVGAVYISERAETRRTICEQRGGVYAGGECIKDGEIIRNNG